MATADDALATGLDITQALVEAGVPLNPVTEGVDALIAGLPDDAKSDLRERGIVEFDGDKPIPLWTLRTTFLWRQKVPAGKSVTIDHTYLPVAGSSKSTPEAIEASRAPFCIEQAMADKLRGLSKGFTWVTYLLNAGAATFGPATKFRLRIETPGPDALVSVCRDGLQPAGPTALEWTATNYRPDDDIRVLFANQ